MTRWWPVGVALVLVGAGVVVIVMQPRGDLPAAQGVVEISETFQIPARVPYDPTTRLPKNEALYALQWLADGVRCPVTDNVSLTASCVLQRYGKMRDKALSARARYEALVGLERDYWGHLRREGFYPVILHCRSPKIQDCTGP